MQHGKSSNLFAHNSLISLKGKDWLDKQRVAGKIAAQALLLLKTEVEKCSGTLTTKYLNDLAETFIEKEGAICTFKNYHRFCCGVCISVNKEMVHGIPSDYVLQNGDLVSFDLGATYQGAIADTAITCIYGTPKSDRHIQLIRDTEEALMRGIAAISVGKRLGVIGQAISKFGHSKGYGVINNYGGHGLDWDTPHAAPFVHNKSNDREGIRIVEGLSIAIEPMLTLGSTSTSTLADGWTVVAPDLNCHFEHSVFVHQDYVEIITDRNSQ